MKKERNKEAHGKFLRECAVHKLNKQWQGFLLLFISSAVISKDLTFRASSFCQSLLLELGYWFIYIFTFMHRIWDLRVERVPSFLTDSQRPVLNLMNWPFKNHLAEISALVQDFKRGSLEDWSWISIHNACSLLLSGVLVVSLAPILVII